MTEARGERERIDRKDLIPQRQRAINRDVPEAAVCLVESGLTELEASIDFDNLSLFDYHDEEHEPILHNRHDIVFEHLQEVLSPEEYDAFLEQVDEELIYEMIEWHDRYLEFDYRVDPRVMFGLLVAQQVSGSSEEKTLELFRKIAGDQCTEEVIEQFAQGFRATIPTFVNGTVRQDGLKPGICYEAALLALYDLGAPIEGPHMSVIEANKLFRERAIGAKMLLQLAYITGEELNDEDKETIASAILSWSEGQLDFINGRIDLIDHDLEPFPPNIREALKDWLHEKHKASRREIMKTTQIRRSLIQGADPSKREETWFEQLLESVGLEPPYLPLKNQDGEK